MIRRFEGNEIGVGHGWHQKSITSPLYRDGRSIPTSAARQLSTLTRACRTATPVHCFERSWSQRQSLRTGVAPRNLLSSICLTRKSATSARDMNPHLQSRVRISAR
jgi:hypothetical protein